VDMKSSRGRASLAHLHTLEGHGTTDLLTGARVWVGEGTEVARVGGGEAVQRIWAAV